MEINSSTLKLVRLAPDPEENPALITNYAAQLAHILNTDRGLPQEYILPQEAPNETAESVLTTAESWCRERNAKSFMIVLENGTVVGAISLSHIDYGSHSARVGYFVTSLLQGRGLGTEALVKLLSIAHELRLRMISASIATDNNASRRIWEKSGASVEFNDSGVTAFLD